MKYFKAKAASPANKKSKRRSEEDTGALKSGDESQSSSSKWQMDKAKDPYRRPRTGWRRTRKVVVETSSDSQSQQRVKPGGGDVQEPEAKAEEHTEDKRVHDGGREDHGGEAAVHADTVAVEVHQKEQQTSATFLGGDSSPLEECVLSVDDYGDDARGSLQDIDEASTEVPIVTEPPTPDDDGEGDREPAPLELNPRLSAELTGLASLVGIASGTMGTAGAGAGTPSASEITSLTPSEESEGIHHWQRGILARLTRARQRRDIRLNRKEVLSLQLLMESVLKQYLALSREVESVKANLQWESMEPLSLSRALARLHSERQEEAASFARMMASKEQEMQRFQAVLQREVHALRDEVTALRSVCREKDDDLEHAATAMATLRAMHQKKMQEARVQMDDRLEQALKEAQDAKEAELRNACARYDSEIRALRQTVQDQQASFDKVSRSLSELQVRMQTEAIAYKKTLDERLAEVSELTAQRAQRDADFQTQLMSLHGDVKERDLVISKLRNTLARVQSTHDMESLSLSRALTEKEQHIAHLMSTMQEQAEQRDSELRDLRADIESRDRSIRMLKDDARQRRDAVSDKEAELAVAKAEIAKLHEDQEAVMVVMSKALSASDSDAAHQAEVIDNLSMEHEKELQSLRNAMDLLKSQKQVDTLSLEQEINDKDIKISGLLIDVQGLQSMLREALERVEREQEEKDGLLKTVQAMNAQQADMSTTLKHTYVQQDQLRNDLAAQQRAFDNLRTAHERELASQRKVMDTDADHFRCALHEKDVRIRELEDLLTTFQRAHEDEKRSQREQLDLKEAEIHKLRATVDSVSASLRGEFAGQLQARDTEIADLRTKLSAKLSALANFEERHETLLEAKNQLEAENETLGKTLQSKDEDIKVLKNSVSQMKTAHKDSTAGLRLECAKKTSEVGELSKSVQSLKAALEKAKGEHKECADSKRAREQELSKMLKAAESSRLRNEEYIVKLKASLREKEERLRALAKEKTTCESEKEELKSEIIHFSKVKENYQSVLDEKENEIHALNEKFKQSQSKFDSQCAGLQQIIEFKEGSLRDLQQRYALDMERARRDKALADSERDKLGKLVLECERVNEALRKAAEEARCTNHATKLKFRKTIKIFQASYKLRLSERAALQEELSAAKEQMMKMQTTIDGHDLERGKLVKATLNKENEMKQLRENLHQYETHLQQTRQEMAVLHERLRLTDDAAQGLQEKLREREVEVTRLQAIRKHNDLELQRLRVAVAEIENLRASERELTDRIKNMEECKEAVHLEMSHKIEELKRTNEDLTLEIDVGRRLLKKNTEEYKSRTEKLQQTIENIRLERDAELTVLKDTVLRLEAQARDAEARIEEVKADRAAEGLSLQHALHGRQEEVERLTEVAEKANNECKQYETKERELRQSIEYLEGEMKHYKEDNVKKDLAIAKLSESLEAAERDAQMRLHAGIQQLQDEVILKDNEISTLEEAVQSLRSGLDLDILEAKRKLADSETEVMQLSSKVSMLEAQLEDQISLMSKQITEKDVEIKELASEKASLLAKYEHENKELAEEANNYLGMIDRLNKEREEERLTTTLNMKEKQAELQAMIQTMNTALRAKDDELEKLRNQMQESLLNSKETAMALEKELAEKLDTMRQKEDELNEMMHLLKQENAKAQLERDSTLSRKDSELKVLNLTVVSLKAEVKSLRDEQAKADSEEKDAASVKEALEKQLKDKDSEVSKLKRTVESLKTDLSIQKELLLTFHEGRAYLGAPSEHDPSMRPPLPVKNLKNTSELMALPQGQGPQDGDHPPASGTVRSHRKHVFSFGEIERGAGLKRTASEGDHLDVQDMFDFSDLSGAETPSTLTISARTGSDMSTESSRPPPAPHNTLLS